MNPITQLFSDNLIQALGWTLLHSLWQGAVFAILLALMLILMRRFTSNTRYLVSVILLSLFFASTALTFSFYNKTAVPSYEPTKQTYSMGLQQYEGAQPDYEGGTFAFEQAREEGQASAMAGIFSYFSNYFQQNIPLIVTLWLLGVLVLLLKFLGGLAMVQRIKYYKSDLLPEYWRTKAEELSRQMKIRQRIVFMRSRIADSPLVIGFFKPAVIMPARVLTGLNEEQIEAILVHELAHIKRQDYPVNILQSLVEILFFFNPSVWWMSNTVRLERENCCDDIALSVTGEAYDYASALIQLEEQRRHHNTQIALAFVGNQHSFTQRIKRLFNQPTLLADFKEGFVTAVVLFAGLFLMAMYVWDTPKVFGDQKQEREIELGELFEGEKGFFNADEVVIENLDKGSFRVILESDKFGKIENDGLKALLDAISDGSLETVRFIIEKGVDVNGQTEHGWTPLLEAIDEGRLDVVKLLLDSGADVNQANKRSWTPLMEAADEGQLEIAQYLISKGADINQSGHNGRTLLMEAIDEGHFEFVKMLVDRGADVNQANKMGWTPLLEAADEGHIEIAEFLMNNAADANQAVDNGRTLLMEAIDEGHLEFVKMLVEKGADVNQANKMGWTPLMEAADEGHVEIAAYLISKGADINKTGSNGRTLLMEAVDEGHVGFVELLLDRGADVNQAAENGWTPLMEAVDEGNLDMIDLLLKRGADMAAAMKTGRGLLAEAVDEGHLEIVEMLMDKGADVNGTGEGITPLMEAADEGHLEIARLLIQKGADVNQASENGYTPLMEAADEAEEEIARLLIDKGADVNHNGESSSFPLLEAIDGGSETIVRMLLDKGADVNFRTSRTWTSIFEKDKKVILIDREWTPLLEAIDEDEIDIAQILIQKGAEVNGGTRREITNVKEKTTEIQTNWTPLMEAVEEENLEMAQLLIRMGAKAKAVTKEGLSVLDVAKGTENKEMIQLINSKL